MKRLIVNNKKLFCILIIVVIFIFVFFLINLKIEKDIDYSNLLKYDYADIVYETTVSGQKAPVINIDGELFEMINVEIGEIYTKNSDKNITYKYNVSGDILSIMLTLIETDSTGKKKFDYVGYNIDLENLVMLPSLDLLNRFGIEEEQLHFYLANKFMNYYLDLVDKGYLTEDKCDYNCFIEECDMFDFVFETEFYVNDGNLEVYKVFNIYTKYNYEDYFSNEPFKFVVV